MFDSSTLEQSIKEFEALSDEVKSHHLRSSARSIQQYADETLEAIPDGAGTEAIVKAFEKDKEFAQKFADDYLRSKYSEEEFQQYETTGLLVQILGMPPTPQFKEMLEDLSLHIVNTLNYPRYMVTVYVFCSRIVAEDSTPVELKEIMPTDAFKALIRSVAIEIFTGFLGHRLQLAIEKHSNKTH